MKYQWNFHLKLHNSSLDNKRLDEWVTVERLNLSKIQPPKAEDKKKVAVSSSSHYSAKSNLEKCKSQSSNSQPSSSLSEIDGVNDTSAPVRNKSTGAITCRKRKGGNEEVKLIVYYLFSSKLN